jgi:hypothetical protein
LTGAYIVSIKAFDQKPLGPMTTGLMGGAQTESGNFGRFKSAAMSSCSKRKFSEIDDPAGRESVMMLGLAVFFLEMVLGIV